MTDSTRNRVACQLQTLLKSFAQTSGLPFAGLLSEERLQRVHENQTGDVYTPAVTLWMFLSQVISPDGSCREAVARLLAWRNFTEQKACSANNGAYCKARQKLDEAVVKELVAETGTQLHEAAEEGWKWKGRSVKLVDGMTFTGPDTVENQAEYPQPDGQKSGLGFPMLRAVALISLAVGSVLETAVSAYSGMGTGEVSLLRKLWHALKPGDLLVGDKIYCSYPEIAVMAARGIDFILPRNASRRTDFRTGKQLGSRDHIITWERPRTRPARLSVQEWSEVPASLTLREVEVRLQRRGFRSKTIVVVTTLLTAAEITAEDLGELYAMRWEIEVDLRCIKASLSVGELRCRTPAMLRLELWTALLAYNLLRGQMAQAAHQANVAPRDISFIGALQTLNAFRMQLQLCEDDNMLSLHTAMASHRVGNRPGRQDPRKTKRRSKHDRLTEPRTEARKRITKPTKI